MKPAGNGLPPSLLDSLEGLPGFDRRSFEEAHAHPEDRSALRLNPLKCRDDARAPGAMAATFFRQEGLQVDRVPWCADGYVLRPRPSFTLDPHLHAGVYYVQEPSSMFLSHALDSLLGASRGLRAIDLCASPGGKSTLLAAMGRFSLLVSNDPVASRIRPLCENMVKWGAPHVLVSGNDPADFSRLPGFFDVLVVDAPCSGSGLIRRSPAAAEEWSPTSVRHCSRRQQRILSDALPCLAAGGLLVYSTCSYSAEENEQVLDSLLSAPGMLSLPIPLEPSWNIVETRSPLHGAYGYRFYPDRLDGEGFFLACLQKQAMPTGQTRMRRIPFGPLPKGTDIAEWISPSTAFCYHRKGDDVFALPEELEVDAQVVAYALSLVRTGVRVGRFVHGRLQPDHELAMSTLLNPATPGIEVDREDAIRYLRKSGDIHAIGPAGWNIVRHHGYPLGLVKVLQNRTNNYYPSEWRIRSAGGS